MKSVVPTVILFAIFLAATAWGDLSGRWSCNDGGTYYLRQDGSRLVWFGESAPERPAWSNVFTGRIREGRIEGRWADVPKGRTSASGTLELVIENKGTRLRAVGKSGGFGGSRWIRAAAMSATEPPVPRLQPPPGDDCVWFDPATVTVRLVDGRWKIVDGGHWVFDFGSDRSAADRALQVIRHYRMDRSCFIGRPDPAFTYMLARGGIPSGPLAGENCLAFDPQAIRLVRVNDRWTIMEGGRRLFDFGRNESDARLALAAIRRHGFSRVCTVGRPKAGFTYLRR